MVGDPAGDPDPEPQGAPPPAGAQTPGDQGRARPGSARAWVCPRGTTQAQAAALLRKSRKAMPRGREDARSGQMGPRASGPTRRHTLPENALSWGEGGRGCNCGGVLRYGSEEFVAAGELVPEDLSHPPSLVTQELRFVALELPPSVPLGAFPVVQDQGPDVGYVAMRCAWFLWNRGWLVARVVSGFWAVDCGRSLWFAVSRMRAVWKGLSL